LTIHETVDKGRILKPMVRDGNKLKEISMLKKFIMERIALQIRSLSSKN
jgi:hypothetical protein